LSIGASVAPGTALVEPRMELRIDACVVGIVPPYSPSSVSASA
jgi:hypothetical protein